MSALDQSSRPHSRVTEARHPVVLCRLSRHRVDDLCLRSIALGIRHSWVLAGTHRYAQVLEGTRAYSRYGVDWQHGRSAREYRYKIQKEYIKKLQFSNVIYLIEVPFCCMLYVVHPMLHAASCVCCHVASAVCCCTLQVAQGDSSSLSSSYSAPTAPSGNHVSETALRSVRL